MTAGPMRECHDNTVYTFTRASVRQPLRCVTANPVSTKKNFVTTTLLVGGVEEFEFYLYMGPVRDHRYGAFCYWLSVRESPALAVACVTAATAVAVAAWYNNYKDCRWKAGNQKYSSVTIRPPLRNITPQPGEASRIVYLTGIDKQTSEEELIDLFSRAAGTCPRTLPVEVDLSEVSFRKGGGGRAWALYRTAEAAKEVVQALHQTLYRGCTLCARLEMGVEKDGRRITDQATTHTAILRSVQTRRGTPRKEKRKASSTASISNDNHHSHPPVTYSHKSISVGSIEYPFPSGMYLTRMIQELSISLKDQTTKQHKNNLLELLSDVSKLGGGSPQQYAKEISEAFAMVDATKRAIKLVVSKSTVVYNIQQQRQPVTCYCLGDGKHPVAASALALTMPDHWRFVSIDPILEVDDERNTPSDFHDRIALFRGLSQDYEIPISSKDAFERLCIVIACHSHAPLNEFWNRVPCPKICITMPCCAQFSELPEETPILNYDNFEVHSPKRRIKIFASL
jgi:hypothetical protein